MAKIIYRHEWSLEGHLEGHTGELGYKLKLARDCFHPRSYLLPYGILASSFWGVLFPFFLLLFPITFGIYSDVFITTLLLQWAPQRSPDHRTAFHWFSFLLFKIYPLTYLILPITSIYKYYSMLSFCSLILGSLL